MILLYQYQYQLEFKLRSRKQLTFWFIGQCRLNMRSGQVLGTPVYFPDATDFFEVYFNYTLYVYYLQVKSHLHGVFLKKIKLAKALSISSIVDIIKKGASSAPTLTFLQNSHNVKVGTIS